MIIISIIMRYARIKDTSTGSRGLFFAGVLLLFICASNLSLLCTILRFFLLLSLGDDHDDSKAKKDPKKE